MGYQSNLEGGFIARRRHLEALELAAGHLQLGKEQLEVYLAGELLAEELRMCQLALSRSLAASLLTIYSARFSALSVSGSNVLAM